MRLQNFCQGLVSILDNNKNLQVFGPGPRQGHLLTYADLALGMKLDYGSVMIRLISKLAPWQKSPDLLANVLTCSTSHSSQG